ncbi:MULTISPECIES: QueT transporter family protein [Lactobacillaceae]|uniref:QueT transporter family protein n=1 Tax=Lactobacillaceae TaxID=33958 RepID=UPI000C1B644C|nr:MULTISPECIES: QueT transporter family protein [Lactobacillaceae]
MNNKTHELTKIAIVAALYIVLTVTPVISILSYGPIQFRVSEVLMILPFLDHKYSWSLIMGCLVANVFSASLGVYDIVFGTIATALVCFIITRVPNNYKNVWIVPVTGSIVNGLIIGAELHYVLKLPFWISAGTVALGELGVLIVGVIIFYFLLQNNNFKSIITR